MPNSFLQRIGLGRPELRAWAMYDWANSAYATVVMAAVLPPFFATYYAAGLDGPRATVVYAIVTTIALLISAVLSPFLGAVTDLLGARKPALAVTTLLGCVSVTALFFVGKGAWLAASGCVVVAAAAFGLSMVFYEGLLPQIARRDEVDQVSAAGYALGYAGGGVLLGINILWILHPEWFGIADRNIATRLSILSVSVWWGLFSLPLFFRVRELRALRAPGEEGVGALLVAHRRLVRTFREIRSYRDLFLFLVAYWFYNDGIGTIIKMATIYGAEIGIGIGHLVRALLLTQLVAFPFAILFGRLGARFGPKRGIYVALGVYMLIAVLGALMRTPAHFYILAAMVGTVQGGAQALSRSLFARMVPRDRSGEFFGFFSVSSKFATILGPALFAAITYYAGSSRLAILSIALFFAVGLVLLRKVDVERGAAAVT